MAASIKQARPSNFLDKAMTEEFTIFAGSANPNLATAIARELGVRLGARNIEKFPDGEISILEFTVESILHKLVVAMVLALRREGVGPMFELPKLLPRTDRHAPARPRTLVRLFEHRRQAVFGPPHR